MSVFEQALLSRGLMPGCAKLPLRLYSFRKNSTCNLMISQICVITVRFLLNTLQLSFLNNGTKENKS
jgi:hypothetical protein